MLLNSLKSNEVEVNRPLRVSVFGGKKDNVPKPEDYPGGWADLVANMRCFERCACTTRDCIGKHCPRKTSQILWCFAHYPEGATRGRDNVSQLDGLVIDVDKPSEEFIEVFLRNLGALGCAAVIHGSHNWERTHSFRVVIPTATPIPVGAYEPVWDAVVAKLTSGCPALEEGCGVDMGCRHPGAIFFVPNYPSNADPLFEEQHGPLLEWGAMSTAPAWGGSASFTLPHHPRRQGARVELPPESSEPVDFERLRARLLGVQKPASRRLMRALLRGEVSTAGGHDNALLQVAGVMAGALWLDVPEAAVLELVRPALAKWNWPDGDVEYALGEFLEKFRRARLWAAQMETERASYDASLAEFKATFGGLR